jgi:hypothetical protein
MVSVYSARLTPAQISRQRQLRQAALQDMGDLAPGFTVMLIRPRSSRLTSVRLREPVELLNQSFQSIWDPALVGGGNVWASTSE